MPGLESLLTFAVAALVVLLVPGPGVLYVVARSASLGTRAGLASAAGLSAGALVHVAGATAGLSALLLASSTAFGIAKLLGAGYLVYLGARCLLGRDTAPGGKPAAPRALLRLFRDGVVVSIFNPKIAIFFLAFLPQFVEPARGPIPPQVLVLGLLYVSMALLTDGAYAVVAGRTGRWLGARFTAGRLPRITTGTIYIGLGVKTALAERT